ncbi:hypothetical protein CPB86DRAFT_788078 [Serendipita vermifera]|nr:hypothetical protein CPB86DRAFT_788078 [Serendipita vermifera]
MFWEIDEHTICRERPDAENLASWACGEGPITELIVHVLGDGKSAACVQILNAQIFYFTLIYLDISANGYLLGGTSMSCSKRSTL